LLYITDVFANLLIISFTTNFLFQKLLQSGKTNKAVKDGLSARIVYRQVPLVNIAIKH